MITKIIDLKELERLEKLEKDKKVKEAKGDSTKSMIQDEDITKVDLMIQE